VLSVAKFPEVVHGLAEMVECFIGTTQVETNARERTCTTGSSRVLSRK